MISLLMDHCRSQMLSSIALHRILERKSSSSTYMKKLRAEVLQWMIVDVSQIDFSPFRLLIAIFDIVVTHY